MEDEFDYQPDHTAFGETMTTTSKRIREKDIKLLWGRPAGLCSICRDPLSQDEAKVNNAVPLGEQAHIVAADVKGPRGKSLLTVAERNSYFNLILLCPNHHTEIDKKEAAWPIEKLHLVKRRHELWVESTLAARRDAKKRAADITYATLIDLAVENCMFERWDGWTSYALEQPPKWRQEWFARFDRFGHAVLAVVWPGRLPELERALQTLSTALEIAAHYFNAHIDREEHGWLIGEKFNRRGFGSPDQFDLKDQYAEWLQCCGRSIFEATMAANWVANAVRRDINPEFFAAKGRFAEAVTAAGYASVAGHISEGYALNLPCRVVTKPSPDGRYINVEKVLPAQAAQKTVPAATATYAPLAYESFIVRIEKQLAVEGIQITEERLALSKSGQRLFGLLALAMPGLIPADYGCVLGLPPENRRCPTTLRARHSRRKPTSK